MYLSIMYPKILPLIREFGGGLRPVKIENKYHLIIKASKEFILTAKINKGFSFYLAPALANSGTSVALITAFFDDDDEPLTILTPLLKDDNFTLDMIQFLQNDIFEVFFFDEHDRELLSYKATGNLRIMRDRILQLPLLGVDELQAILESTQLWFSMRSDTDDINAFDVRLTERLFPDDFVTMDMRVEKHAFFGSKSFSSNSLERKEPGQYQELDIAFLLQRTFDTSQIYLNPVKELDGKEFVDIMVVGKEAVFLIQAKDSPNTENILRNKISRKRAKSISQIKAGADQLLGAVSFVRKDPLLRFVFEQQAIEVDVSSKMIIGIIVIKELFNDSFQDYSKTVFDLVEKAQICTTFFDYPELNMMTLHCQSEDKFLNAIDQIWNVAIERGEFPRLRYSGKPE